MVNTRVLSTKRRNAVRCRARTKSPKSDRTPPKAIPINLRRSHDCVLAETPKGDTFPCILRPKPPKAIGPPQIVHGIELYKEFRRTLIWSCLALEARLPSGCRVPAPISAPVAQICGCVSHVTHCGGRTLEESLPDAASMCF